MHKRPPVSTRELSGSAGEPASAGRLASEIAAAKIQAKIFILASLVDAHSTENWRKAFPRAALRPPRCETSEVSTCCRAPPQIRHVAIARDCPSAPFRSRANMLQRISPLVLPDAWLPAASYGGNDLLFGVLMSIDRLCCQFATALEHAEHQHLSLLAALLGTLTLMFRTHH